MMVDVNGMDLRVMKVSHNDGLSAMEQYNMTMSEQNKAWIIHSFHKG